MKHYLVQRLTSKDVLYPRDKGFDRYFSLDYMGSSEFEWGAIPKALKRMRERKVKVEAQAVTIGGITRDVYFVGHEAELATAASDIETWAANDFRGKESSQFQNAFAGTSKDWHHADAWWSIEDTIAFALNEEVARRLESAFNNKPDEA